MTDIRAYPNQLLKIFVESVGGVFDPGGDHVFANGSPTVAQLNVFITEALTDSENLQRLQVDGSITKASVKVLYEGQVGNVWNSALANDFAERAGSEVGTIDRTKLGQFVFRSKLKTFVDGLTGEIEFDINKDLSKEFIKQNPVDKYKFFLPDEPWLADNAGKSSIMRGTEIPTAIANAPDHALFEGLSKAEIIEARGNATGYGAGESDFNQLRQAYYDDLRVNEPSLYQSTRPADLDPVNGRVLLASMDINPESLANKGLGNLTLSPISSGIPSAGQVTKDLAIRELSFAKSLQDIIYRYADKVNVDFLKPFYEGTKTNFLLAVDELSKTLKLGLT